MTRSIRSIKRTAVSYPNVGKWLLGFASLALEILGFGELMRKALQGMPLPAIPWPWTNTVLKASQLRKGSRKVRRPWPNHSGLNPANTR